MYNWRPALCIPSPFLSSPIFFTLLLRIYGSFFILFSKYLCFWLYNWSPAWWIPLSLSVSLYLFPLLLRIYGRFLYIINPLKFYLASIYAIGCITGALHGGYLSDKLGRKKCMILDCLGYITGKRDSTLEEH